MHKKLILAPLALVAALSLGVSGCAGGSGASSPSGGGSAGDVTITFLTHWGTDQVTALETAAGAFTAKNPNIHVKVQAVPFANLLTTLRTQGSSESGPTIAGIYDAWLPELVRDGFADKAPEDVSSDVTANWPASAAKPATSDGSVHGIPNEIDLYQLNYNKALFAKAKLSAAPKTYDELVADAKALKAAGVKQPIGFITNWGSGAVHPFLSLMASNGQTFLSPDGKRSNLTSSQALETAKLYQTLRDEKLTEPNMSSANANTTGPYLDNFVNGNTGMIIMANWWESSLKDAMGDKFSNVATAPIPVGPSGSQASAISYTWMTMVNGNANAAQKTAAWAFLKWLNSPESGKNGSSAMGDILMSMGILPSRTSDQKAHEAGLSGAFLSSYVSSLATATPFPTVLGGPAAADELQKSIESLLFGKVNAEEAMKQADSAVNSALAAAQG